MFRTTASLWITLLLSLCLTACGGDDSANDGGTDATVDARPDVPTGNLDCAGLGNGETRCEGDDVEVCNRGSVSTRSCRSGTSCSAGACECNNRMDGECPAGCATDPDCAGCTPMCAGASCGDDGCGGVCGSCGPGTICEGTQCVEFTGVCEETCEFSMDGECDDTGEDGEGFCAYGTDCFDCGLRDAPTCDDFAQNGDETGIDCGGSCPPCTGGATCEDGVMNGDETGVDCGGSCAACATESIGCTINYNEDCPAGQRCDCDSSTGACACAPGARGTGGFGTDCAAQHDCASGLCVDDKCTQRCDTGGDCEASLPSCQPILGFCVAGSCTPDCTGRTCGDDGCGGSCGLCGGGEVCNDGTCEAGATSAYSCPGATPPACEAGQACCRSQGGLARCFENGGGLDAMCAEQADVGVYIYIGCKDDDDCPGQVCCGSLRRTFCADSCEIPATEACDPSAALSCAGSPGSRCCEINPPLWYSGPELGIGRCLPTSLPCRP